MEVESAAACGSRDAEEPRARAWLIAGVPVRVVLIDSKIYVYYRTIIIYNNFYLNISFSEMAIIRACTGRDGLVHLVDVHLLALRGQPRERA